MTGRPRLEPTARFNEAVMFLGKVLSKRAPCAATLYAYGNVVCNPIVSVPQRPSTYPAEALVLGSSIAVVVKLLGCVVQ